MNKNLLRQILVLIAVIATITINVLANALPINGQNTGDISDTFDVYFVPAGYVFSIWGLIYLGLLAYAIFQVLPAQRDNPRLRSIDWPFLIGSAANIVWIFCWHYNLFPLSLLAMAVLLVSLIVIYLRLNIGRAAVPRPERWLVHLPFSIYLGWITVATIANVTDVLYDIGWSGWGVSEEAWFVIMTVVALIVATLMTLTRADVAYLLVLAWAFAGIAIKHGDTQVVSMVAWLATLIVVALALLSVIRRRRGWPAVTAAT